MYEGVDTIVLYEELAYQDVLPIAWKPLRAPLDSIAVASITDRNIKTLQVCAAIEEHGSVDLQDDKSPNAADLMRLEVKMNLVMDLLGQILAASVPRPQPASIRFNALGATWRSQTPFPQVGTMGLLEIYLRDCIAQPLVLVARISGVNSDGQVKAEFTPPGEATADLIEKLAFRRHRRGVAGVRQPRRA
ncbi:MAG: PilZ domain-containing protein [Pseudomonadota bacterium]